MQAPSPPSDTTPQRCHQIETLLMELSARFVNLPSHQVDGEIENAQRRICDHLDLDRSSLWQQCDPDPTLLMMTHVFQRTTVWTPADKVYANAMFPWFTEKLNREETVILSTLDDLPPEAWKDRDALQKNNTHSAVVVPMPLQDGRVGALTFASSKERDGWPEDIVKRLRLIAEIFANAITRAAADTALRESKARLQLAVESGQVGLWVMTPSAGHVWASDRLREMFGFAPEITLDYGNFSDTIHTEDREGVDEAVQQALNERGEFHSDFRVVHPDGQTRWISAHGRACCDDNGDLCRLMGASIDVTERMQMEKRLLQSFEEIDHLRNQLQQQNLYLKQEVEQLQGRNRIIGQSHPLKRVLLQAKTVAPLDSTVLLLGETGTGKELIASAIHEMSPRANQPMIRVNCSAMPASLIESELFGREVGAYTGALSRQVGRFELANGSTLLLDEIGELSIEIQVKLLRVLEEKTIQRLGSSETIPVDVRIITATNRDLKAAVDDQTFRQDLYYRLNVFPITVPPLRQRHQDIPAMVCAFVDEFNRVFSKSVLSVSQDSMDKLQQYDWPGNVRELRNVVERAMIMATGPTLSIHVPTQEMDDPTLPLTLKQAEHDHVRRVLELAGWRVRGKDGAAEILGVRPTTLESRMAKLGIRRPDANDTK